MAWGFKTDFRDLEQLKRINAILLGIQPECTGNNPVLVEWLKLIKELAYHFEDVMDEYSNALVKGKIKTTFFFSVSSNPVVFRFQMARKFKSLKESINQIYDQAKQLGIMPVEVSDDHNIHAEPSVQRQMSNYEVLFRMGDEEDQIIGSLRDKLTDITTLLGECVVNCFDCNEP